MKEREKSFLFRMSEETHRKLKIEAALTGDSIQGIIERLVLDHLAKAEKRKTAEG